MSGPHIKRASSQVAASAIFASVLITRTQCSGLEQTLNEPLRCPFHLFAHGVELPKHAQEIVGQDFHEQPRLIGKEAVATRLVLAQHVVPLFDAVRNGPTIVAHTDHFPGREFEIGPTVEISGPPRLAV